MGKKWQAMSKPPSCINFGVRSVTGKRDYMEDEYICNPKFGSTEQEYELTLARRSDGGDVVQALFSVIDGHGGKNAAKFIKKTMSQTIASFLSRELTSDDCQTELEALDDGAEDSITHLFTEDTMETVFVSSFIEVDSAWSKVATRAHSGRIDYSGACAIVALIVADRLYVANVGDCRVILCRNGSPVVLSTDHRPSKVPAEKARVVRAGGFVSNQGVNGVLEISRALGDLDFKLPWANKDKQTCYTEDLVIPIPDVQYTTINVETDRFVVVACDGLHEVMSNIDIVNEGLECFDRSMSCQDTAKHLVKEALVRGSSDNITAVVIHFGNVPEGTKKKTKRQKKRNEKKR